ncbi:hypothetical protein VTN02DRAFT_5237 [Thermoascus thermophilus]
MAPIRRYLRISKYSVLECRIYLENPSDTRWLLNPRDPVLPRIFEAIRPLVLPKLREENERAMAKKKSNPVKDVIVEDEFEVAIFLRESRTRHTLLTRQKIFGEAKRITSNSTKLTGMDEGPARIDDDSDGGDAAPGVLVESDNESGINLADVPEASEVEGTEDHPKRRRRALEDEMHPAPKRKRPEEQLSEDDKKLGLNTTYDGFNIWGWVLCLLVTRKGEKVRTAKAGSEASGQVLMEEWISTQTPGDLDEV